MVNATQKCKKKHKLIAIILHTHTHRNIQTNEKSFKTYKKRTHKQVKHTKIRINFKNVCWIRQPKFTFQLGMCSSIQKKNKIKPKDIPSKKHCWGYPNRVYMYSFETLYILHWTQSSLQVHTLIIYNTQNTNNLIIPTTKKTTCRLHTKTLYISTYIHSLRHQIQSNYAENTTQKVQ